MEYQKTKKTNTKEPVTSDMEKPEEQKQAQERLSNSATLGIFSLLSSDPRVDVDMKDRNGRTPLSIMSEVPLFSAVSMYELILTWF